LREELTEKLSNILLGEKIPLDVVNAETGEIIIPANRKITKTLLRKLATVYDHIEIDPSPIRIKIARSSASLNIALASSTWNAIANSTASRAVRTSIRESSSRSRCTSPASAS